MSHVAVVLLFPAFFICYRMKVVERVRGEKVEQKTRTQMHVMVEALLVLSMSCVGSSFESGLHESGISRFDHTVLNSVCGKPVDESSVDIDEGRTFCGAGERARENEPWRRQAGCRRRHDASQQFCCWRQKQLVSGTTRIYFYDFVSWAFWSRVWLLIIVRAELVRKSRVCLGKGLIRNMITLLPMHLKSVLPPAPPSF